MRSQRFVGAFCALRPAPFAAGVSSSCRPDRHDIDWAAWRGGGFAFLPQAYVNDIGAEGRRHRVSRARRRSSPGRTSIPRLG